MMPNQDKEEEERERSLRAADSRIHQRNFRPRMRMLDDDPVPLAELGTRQSHFIEPDDVEATSIRNSRKRRKMY